MSVHVNEVRYSIIGKNINADVVLIPRVGIKEVRFWDNDGYVVLGGTDVKAAYTYAHRYLTDEKPAVVASSVNQIGTRLLRIAKNAVKVLIEVDALIRYDLTDYRGRIKVERENKNLRLRTTLFSLELRHESGIVFNYAKGEWIEQTMLFVREVTMPREVARAFLRSLMEEHPWMRNLINEIEKSSENELS